MDEFPEIFLNNLKKAMCHLSLLHFGFKTFSEEDELKPILTVLKTHVHPSIKSFSLSLKRFSFIYPFFKFYLTRKQMIQEIKIFYNDVILRSRNLMYFSFGYSKLYSRQKE